MTDYRSHTATRPVILVIGSPEPQRHGKPPRYPSNQREHWRPAQHPPRLSKAERVARFLDAVKNQDQNVRAFLDAARAASHRCDEMIPSDTSSSISSGTGRQ